MPGDAPQTKNEWVSPGPHARRAVSVCAGSGRILQVVWEDGDHTAIDISNHIATHWAFERLRNDDAHFRQVRLMRGGDGVCWGDDDETIEAIPFIYFDYAYD